MNYRGVISILALASISVAFNPGSILLDYNPSVTEPSGGEVWLAGGTYSASWNQSLPGSVDPSTIGQTASFVLGYQSEGSNNLNWTLASAVPLYAPNPNTVSFTLPSDLEFRTTYIIALIGSSGDISKPFTILPSLFASSSGTSVAGRKRFEAKRRLRPDDFGIELKHSVTP